jgi:hypothetical protein
MIKNKNCVKVGVFKYSCITRVREHLDVYSLPDKVELSITKV